MGPGPGGAGGGAPAGKVMRNNSTDLPQCPSTYRERQLEWGPAPAPSRSPGDQKMIDWQVLVVVSQLVPGQHICELHDAPGGAQPGGGITICSTHCAMWLCAW